MRAGLLNRRLHLQNVVMTADAIEGVSSEAWTDIDLVWGHISPITGREEFMAGQTQERITHQVTIRWRSDVTPKMRFRYQETSAGILRIFLIHTMLDLDEGHRQLDCMCEEFITVAAGST
jgi:SPP1 family predicted phage head-tail adaptor